MIVPVLIAAGAGVALWKKHKATATGMTPERKAIFESALQDPKLEPEKITALAGEFQTAGLKAEATELKKRAAILTAPPAVVAQRKDAFLKALKSTDQAAVKKVAAAFHSVGHYKAATQLRAYAKGLVGFGKPSVSATVTGEG